jgi:cytochrome c-type biogenesis protein CcmE
MEVASETAQPRRNLGTRRRMLVAGLIVAAGVGFLVTRALGDSVVYFRTADEAVADKAELGTRRFRIEGTVLAGSVRSARDTTEFTIAEKGTRVDVVHEGDPPELFQPGIPVVLEGRWAGQHFASDRIMVKHSEQYRAGNPERVKDYTSE